MSRHHDRTIRQAQAAVAEVGRPAERTEPRSRAEIESFVKGFGLSAAATRRLVDEWAAELRRAWDAGWESHAEDSYYN